jgi:quinol monooxygenase YgiN
LGIGLLLGSLLEPACAVGQDKEDSIVAFIKGRLKDPDKPFTLIVGLKVKKGMGSKLESAFARASKATHKEKGCLAYDLHRDTQEPTRYLVYERWKNVAALRKHLQTAHTKALLKEVDKLSASPPEVQVLVPVGE